MVKVMAATFLLFLFAVPASRAADNIKAFPPAEEGMVRYVLQLPKQADESAFKVELIVGKTVQVDERNRYFFPGEIQEETIQGWGFTLYKVCNLGPMAGTLMAVDPNELKWPGLSRLAPFPISSDTIASCQSWSMSPTMLKCVIGSGLPERRQ